MNCLAPPPRSINRNAWQTPCFADQRRQLKPDFKLLIVSENLAKCASQSQQTILYQLNMQADQSYPLSQKLRDFSSPHALIASGCFSGLSPFASGTTGSFAALIFWSLLAASGVIDTIAAQLLVFALVTVVGLYSTDQFLKSELNKKIVSRKEGDPGVVVIDEWSGMILTLINGVPLSPTYLFLGFLLFRLFDVIKPGPVNSLQKLPGTWGVMLDDVGAGLIGLAVMQVIKYFFF